jgi:hypothetical protein
MVSEILACSSVVLPAVVVKICPGSPRNEGGFTYTNSCSYCMSEACTITVDCDDYFSSGLRG